MDASITGWGLQLSDQCLSGCGIAHLGAGDEVDEGVAVLGPRLGSLGPFVDVGGLVAGLDLFLGAHQAGVGEVGGGLVDLRKVLVVGIDDGRVVLARQVVEARILEAGMAHFQRMAQREVARRARQELQESLDVLRIELLGRHELPVDGPQPVAQLDQALAHEALHRFARFVELAPVGAVARSLHGEDEACGRLVAPFGPARRLEARIIGAVDLDRGELAAGIFQLALLRQILRIERPAPRLEGPAADTDIDLARHRLLLCRTWRPSTERDRALARPSAPSAGHESADEDEEDRHRGTERRLPKPLGSGDPVSGISSHTLAKPSAAIVASPRKAVELPKASLT